MTQWWTGALVVMLAGTLGYYIRLMIGRYAASSSERDLKRLQAEAGREADNIRKEAALQAKSEALKAREALEDEVKRRRQEVVALEERMNQREVNLDRKVAMIDKKNQLIEQKLAEAEKNGKELQQQRETCDALIKQEKDKLQRIAGMTPDEARRTLMARLEEEGRG